MITDLRYVRASKDGMADGPETEHMMSDTRTTTAGSTSSTAGSFRPLAHLTVRDLLGVRCFNGDDSGGGAGSGAGNDSTGATGGDAGGQPAGQPNPNPPSDGGDRPPKNDSGAPGDGEKKFTQADLDKKIDERLAREKKKQGDIDAKVTAAQQEAADAKAAQQRLLDVIAEATGGKKSDQPPDPAALQQMLTQRENRVGELEGQVAERDVLLDAWAAAWDHGADPKRLMDSVTFRGELAQLDRKATDLPKQITDLVKAKVDADESLKSAGTPRTPRPDPSQGSGRPAPAGGERGSAEAERRFGKKPASTTT